MKKISAYENKKIVIELLDFFDKVCKKNNIEYSLSGGSLLGAVRHHGFIPWDDDADVMLTRPNYERIKKIFSSMEESKFGFINENHPGYYYGFSKLYNKKTWVKTLSPLDRNLKDLGVYIDIFPIDKIPDEEQNLQRFSTEIRELNDHLFLSVPGVYYTNQNWFKRNIKRVLFYPRYLKENRLHKTPSEWHALVLDKLKQFDDTDAQNGGFILSEYSTKEIIPYATFMKYRDIKFEGRMFRAIFDYKTYLTALYGEYMELPPKKKRHPKHAYIEYWKE